MVQPNSKGLLKHFAKHIAHSAELKAHRQFGYRVQSTWIQGTSDMLKTEVRLKYEGFRVQPIVARLF